MNNLFRLGNGDYKTALVLAPKQGSQYNLESDRVLENVNQSRWRFVTQVKQSRGPGTTHAAP